MPEDQAGPRPAQQGGSPDPPLLGRLDHVGVAVPDLEQGLAFYRDILGLRLGHSENNVEQGVHEAMLSTDGRNGPWLQLLAPIDATSPISRFLDRSGPGLQQLAFAVEDVEAVAAALRRQGIRVLYERARLGTGGARINFLHPRDTGGVLIELVEVPAGRPGPPEDAEDPDGLADPSGPSRRVAPAEP